MKHGYITTETKEQGKHRVFEYEQALKKTMTDCKVDGLVFYGLHVVLLIYY